MTSSVVDGRQCDVIRAIDTTQRTIFYYQKKMKAIQEEERQISVESIALGMADLKVEWGKEGAV